MATKIMFETTKYRLLDTGKFYKNGLDDFGNTCWIEMGDVSKALNYTTPGAMQVKSIGNQLMELLLAVSKGQSNE